MRSKLFKMTVMAALILSIFGSTYFPQDAFASKNENEMILKHKYKGENAEWVNNYKKNIKENMDRIGVKKSKQKDLLQKLANGNMLDSDNPEKVEEVMDELVLTSDTSTKSYEFEDGSILKVGIEKKDPTISKLEVNSLQSITPYSVKCGTGYCNYTDYEISADTTTLRTSATVSFSIVSGVNNADSISSISDLLVTVYGGTFSDKSYAITRATEDVYNDRPAQAHAAFITTYTGNIVSTTTKLRLHVGEDGYSVYLY